MLTTHIENRIIVYKSFCSLRMRQLTIDFELADSSVYNDANSISKSMTRIHQQVNDANSSASQWREFISKSMTRIHQQGNDANRCDDDINFLTDDGKHIALKYLIYLLRKKRQMNYFYDYLNLKWNLITCFDPC